MSHAGAHAAMRSRMEGRRAADRLFGGAAGAALPWGRIVIGLVPRTWATPTPGGATL